MRIRSAPTGRCLRAAPPIAEAGMERIVQLLDELEDIVSALRQRFGLWPAD
jgi:hypothetical protein